MKIVKIGNGMLLWQGRAVGGTKGDRGVPYTVVLAEVGEMIHENRQKYPRVEEKPVADNGNRVP